MNNSLKLGWSDFIENLHKDVKSQQQALLCKVALKVKLENKEDPSGYLNLLKQIFDTDLKMVELAENTMETELSLYEFTSTLQLMSR